LSNYCFACAFFMFPTASAWYCRKRSFRLARACSRPTLDFSRPITVSHSTPMSSRDELPPLICGCIVMGNHTCDRRSTDSPKDSDGVTPTTVKGVLLRVIVCPTTEGLRANLSCHSP